MKLHQETSALGAFGVVGLATFSCVIYFGYGARIPGALFGVLTLVFGGFVIALARVQRGKQWSGTSP